MIHETTSQPTQCAKNGTLDSEDFPFRQRYDKLYTCRYSPEHLLPNIAKTVVNLAAKTFPTNAPSSYNTRQNQTKETNMPKF